MKWIVIGLLFVGALGAAGFIWLKQTGSSSVSTETSAYKTQPVTISGMFQASKGDDFNYAILSNGKLTGVASQKEDLGKYVGKTVKITGQYSGTTLYADSVIATP